jgi:outer membrane protein
MKQVCQFLDKKKGLMTMYNFRFVICAMMMWIFIHAAFVAAVETPIEGGNGVQQSAAVGQGLVEPGNLDLETAILAALSKNPTIGAAIARVQQAKQRVVQARSGYFPRVDATGSAARVKLSETDYQTSRLTAQFIGPSAQTDNPEDHFNIGISASYTLFDGFERKFRNAAARYGEAASTAALEDTRRLMASTVAASFLGAQLALENVYIAKADEDFNHRLLEEAQIKHRVGTGTLSDVLNFQVRMNQAVTNRINQENDYYARLYSLAALMGLSDARPTDDTRPIRLDTLRPDDLIRPDAESLVRQAVDTRPDLSRMRADLQQAEVSVGIARADYYPTVSLSGAWTGERIEDPGFKEDDFGNRVQLNLSYNLFSGGLTRAGVFEAEERKIEVDKNLQNQVLVAASEVRTAVTGVLSAQTQVTLQQENAALVTQTRDLVEKEYRAGQGSLVRLNEAQRDLTNAQGQLALAMVALRQAWIELETRSGPVPSRYLP